MHSTKTSYPSKSASPLSQAPPAVEVITQSTPVRHTLTTTPSSRSISLHGWTITSTKLPICSSSECDELSTTLGIPMPEMLFAKNSVSITGPGGWSLDFNTVDGLNQVDKTGKE